MSHAQVPGPIGLDVRWNRSGPGAMPLALDQAASPTALMRTEWESNPEGAPIPEWHLAEGERHFDDC